MMRAKPVTAVNLNAKKQTPRFFPSIRETSRKTLRSVSTETLRKRIAAVCENGGGPVSYGKSNWYFTFTK